jgi:HEAT repeat protein
MASYNPERSIDSLIDALRAQSDDLIGCSDAYWELVRFGGDRAVMPLITILQDANEQSHIRSAVARALGQIGDQRALAALSAIIGEKSVDMDVRKGSAWALPDFGAIAFPHLAPIAMSSEEDSDLRNVAAMAIGNIDDPDAVDGLLALLSSENPKLRYEAVNALLTIGDARASEPLLSLVSDSHAEVRCRAIGGLGYFKVKEAVEPLIQIPMAKNERRIVSAAAALALGQIGDKRALEPLIRVLRTGGRKFSRAIIDALGELGDTRAIDPLVDLMNAPLSMNWCNLRQLPYWLSCVIHAELNGFLGLQRT